ncbi:MAG: HugZ family protein, partial [Rhizobium sp.]
MTQKPLAVRRETDQDALRLARILLRSARYAAIAVVAPDSGFPAVSRVLVGTDLDGVPVILVSMLSAHTKALALDPRASLLA